MEISLVERYPAEHGAGVVLPVEQYVPAGHVMLCAGVGQYEPAGHVTWEVDPGPQ